ncbi:ATP synthase subunit d, mitochondrial [Exaiptasia diaphana]|uniref:ATP synthase subunit d, mitochondrial n=1 Tax=Exaiptasia diaphana TaxID=2652724 RepID=A0A913XA91_EXADI|nr:ATP synthase subunit d, mitochondrial [Exaiptasia diaphana]KXJ26547.1 ATP synthase subunit d, mitochondrial [Exaiptasia diaphana]
MAARRIGKYIPDWVKISTRVPPEARADMGRYRTSYEGLKTSLDSVSAKPEPIDWEFYAKNISKPGLVSSFQKAFEAITVPYPKDTKSAIIADREKEMEKLCEQLKKESLARIKEYEAELAQVKAQKPFEDMTIEEYLEDHPELKKQAQEELKQHIWK